MPQELVREEKSLQWTLHSPDFIFKLLFILMFYLISSALYFEKNQREMERGGDRERERDTCSSGALLLVKLSPWVLGHASICTLPGAPPLTPQLQFCWRGKAELQNNSEHVAENIIRPQVFHS